MTDQTYAVDHPYRRKLPKKRKSETISAQVGDTQVYIHLARFEDGSLGEIFLSSSKQGSFSGAMLDAFAIAISMGLQYGVPLESFVSKFIEYKFEPHGRTDDPEIQEVRSILDYIFRRLAKDFLSTEQLGTLGVK